MSHVWCPSCLDFHEHSPLLSARIAELESKLDAIRNVVQRFRDGGARGMDMCYDDDDMKEIRTILGFDVPEPPQ